MVATDITGQLAQYMAEARQRSLPLEVVQAGKHRILDSLGAMSPAPGLRRESWRSGMSVYRVACRKHLFSQPT